MTFPGPKFKAGQKVIVKTKQNKVFTISYFSSLENNLGFEHRKYVYFFEGEMPGEFEDGIKLPITTDWKQRVEG